MSPCGLRPKDAGKAMVGLAVSLALAFGLPALAKLIETGAMTSTQTAQAGEDQRVKTCPAT